MTIYIPWWALSGILFAPFVAFWIYVGIETYVNPIPIKNAIYRTTKKNYWKWYPGFIILLLTILFGIIFFLTI